MIQFDTRFFEPCRPLPSWYDEAKVGIFIHWGLFSVPSYGGGKSGCEWFWENWVGRKDPWIVHFMQRNYLKTFTYPDFGPQFKAELFDPQKWVDLFERAGAKWVHSMHTLRGVTMVLCVQVHCAH